MPRLSDTYADASYYQSESDSQPSSSRSQSVTIAGMGCDSFAVFSKAINAITTVFERHATAAKTVTGLERIVNSGTLSFSNRYFTQHDEVDDLTPIPFSQQI
ncbi:hypothetical protein QCA50_019443 [Cerrena zonata]|uniref:Uncharacterized protein n=1 Tax=Cerrena zonata TaxID=2478898 RepID=A0AAW0FCD4_9APHY